MAAMRPCCIERSIAFWFRAFLTFLLLSCQSLAWSSVDSGRMWLAAQVAIDGTVTDQGSSLALTTQVQSETARTLDALGEAVPAALLQQIQQSPQATTEYLVRYRLASNL